MYSISNVAVVVAEKVGTITMKQIYREACEMARTWTFWGSAWNIVCFGEGMLRSCSGKMSILESNHLYDLFSQEEFTGDFLDHLTCHPGLYMRDEIC
jgi:hypothetical protein